MDDRHQVLQTWAEKDILDLKRNFLENAFGRLSKSTQIELSRLLLVIVSSRVGREYLLTHQTLNVLLRTLKSEIHDSDLRQNLLSILQRLSLR
jgi:hypothetical protein